MNCEMCRGRGWVLRTDEYDLVVLACTCRIFENNLQAHQAAQDALAAWSDPKAVVRRILAECSRETIRAVMGALENALTLDKLDALEDEPDEVPTDEDWAAYDRGDPPLGCVTNGPVRVLFVDLNEGDDGEYDPTDPGDTPLLRFEVEHKVDGEWEPVDNGSYCTRVPRTTDADTRMKLLRLIEEEVHLPVTMGTSIKHVCDRLSALEASWAETGIPKDALS